MTESDRISEAGRTCRSRQPHRSRLPESQADKVGVPYSWIVPLGALLAAGAAGLLAGIAVPALGIVATAGLVLYFVGALMAHVRVRVTRSLPPV